MTDTRAARAASEQSVWVGWIAFGAAMMVLLGIFHAFQGFVALVDEQYFVVPEKNLLVHLDYTVWGWTHLVGGAVLIVAGLALLVGKTWARVVGVVVAMLSALVNVAFLAAYPLWSVIMIAVDVLVIWSITLHGHEMKTDVGVQSRHG
jgi:hypothetical protein